MAADAGPIGLVVICGSALILVALFCCCTRRRPPPPSYTQIYGTEKPTYSKSETYSSEKPTYSNYDSDREETKDQKEQVVVPPPERPTTVRRGSSGMGLMDEFKPEAYRGYLRNHSDADLMRQLRSKERKVGISTAGLAADAAMFILGGGTPLFSPVTYRSRSVNKQKLVVIMQELEARRIKVTKTGWYRET